ncbi:alpha-protein kinase 3 isoform X2 [Hyperolius riggenbachi]|uniref:alpha-protein kinase 3 isoform X2 n=1 Tax=Hyperolius riggenbachi TaxID=752182 RepID=UPI0035A29CBE
MGTRRPMTRVPSGNGRYYDSHGSSNGNTSDSEDSNGYTPRADSRSYLLNVRPENRTTFCNIISQLTEETQPSFETTLKTKAVSEGNDAKLICMVTGFPEPEVTWYKDDEEMDRYCGLPKYEIFRSGKKHTLQLYKCSEEDAAIYQASARNNKGIVSCSGVLEVGTMNEYKIHQRWFAKLKRKAEAKMREIEQSRRRVKENLEEGEILRALSPERIQRKRRFSSEKKEDALASPLDKEELIKVHIPDANSRVQEEIPKTAEQPQNVVNGFIAMDVGQKKEVTTNGYAVPENIEENGKEFLAYVYETVEAITKKPASKESYAKKKKKEDEPPLPMADSRKVETTQGSPKKVEGISPAPRRSRFGKDPAKTSVEDKMEVETSPTITNKRFAPSAVPNKAGKAVAGKDAMKLKDSPVSISKTNESSIPQQPSNVQTKGDLHFSLRDMYFDNSSQNVQVKKTTPAAIRDQTARGDGHAIGVTPSKLSPDGQITDTPKVAPRRSKEQQLRQTLPEVKPKSGLQKLAGLESGKHSSVPPSHTDENKVKNLKTTEQVPAVQMADMASDKTTSDHAGTSLEETSRQAKDTQALEDKTISSVDSNEGKIKEETLQKLQNLEVEYMALQKAYALLQQQLELSQKAEAEKEEAMKAEAERAAAMKAEAERAESMRAEAQRAEALKAEAQRAEAMKAEAKLAETMKAEAQRAEVRRAKARREEAERAEAKKKEAERVEAMRAESKRAEAKRAEAKRAEAMKREAERAAAMRAEAERAEAMKREAERAAAIRAEAERAEAMKREAERAAAIRAEAERAEAMKREAERAEAMKREAERVEAIRAEAERAEAMKREAERAEAMKREAERAEAKRAEAKRLEAMKREAEKAAAINREAERAEAIKREVERAEAMRVEAERAEEMKREAERAEAMRVEAERAEAMKREAERAEAIRVEAERAEAMKREAERAEAMRLEAERAKAIKREVERAEAIKREAERAESIRLEAERAEAMKREAERAEAIRVEAERAEAIRVEAERVEAMKAEAQRAEAMRAEAQRAEAMRTEAQRADAMRAEAQRSEAMRVEAQRAKVMRAEAMQAEAVRAEAKRAEVQRAEAMQAEAQRAEAMQAEAQRAEAIRAEAESAEEAAQKPKAQIIETKKAEAQSTDEQKIQMPTPSECTGTPILKLKEVSEAKVREREGNISPIRMETEEFTAEEAALKSSPETQNKPHNTSQLSTQLSLLSPMEFTSEEQSQNDARHGITGSETAAIGKGKQSLKGDEALFKIAESPIEHVAGILSNEVEMTEDEKEKLRETQSTLITEDLSYSPVQENAPKLSENVQDVDHPADISSKLSSPDQDQSVVTLLRDVKNALETGVTPKKESSVDLVSRQVLLTAPHTEEKCNTDLMTHTEDRCDNNRNSKQSGMKSETNLYFDKENVQDNLSKHQDKQDHGLVTTLKNSLLMLFHIKPAESEDHKSEAKEKRNLVVSHPKSPGDMYSPERSPRSSRKLYESGKESDSPQSPESMRSASTSGKLTPSSEEDMIHSADSLPTSPVTSRRITDFSKKGEITQVESAPLSPVAPKRSSKGTHEGVLLTKEDLSFSPATSRKIAAKIASGVDFTVPSIVVGSLPSEISLEGMLHESQRDSNRKWRSSENLSPIPSATPEELASGARRKIYLAKPKQMDDVNDDTVTQSPRKESPNVSPGLSRRSNTLLVSQSPPVERRSPGTTRRLAMLEVPKISEESVDQEKTSDSSSQETKDPDVSNKEQPQCAETKKINDPYKAPQVIRKIRAEQFSDASGNLKIWCQFFNILSASDITWYKDEVQVAKVKRCSGDEGQVALAIVQASVKDCGVYQCTIENEYGTDSTDCLLSAEILSGFISKEEVEVGEEIEMTPMVFAKGLADSGYWGDKFFGRIVMEEAHAGNGFLRKSCRVKVIYGLDPMFESGKTCMIKIRNLITFGTKNESTLVEKNYEITIQDLAAKLDISTCQQYSLRYHRRGLGRQI